MKQTKFNSEWKIFDGVDGPFAAVWGMAPVGKPITLPHDAMIEEERSATCESGNQSGFYPAKAYTYVKDFEAPKSWMGKQIYVEFEGIMRKSMVYVNGKFAGRNASGYSQFFVYLNPFLVYGKKNTIKVVAVNQELASRWYSGSGIYRDVNLCVGGEVHTVPEGVRISTESIDADYADICVSSSIKNAGDEVKTVRVINTFFNQKGKRVASGENRVTLEPSVTAKTVMHITVDKPALWSIDSPSLYKCVTEIRIGNTLVDTTENTFGIRTLQLDARNGLRINGKSVKLRGACIHHDNGIIGATTLYDAELFRLKNLKAAGFNAIRSAHNPMGKAMLRACDELGFIVMDELSDMWLEPKNCNDFSLDFEESWQSEAERIVAKDYNHPCVALYSLGNEIPEIGRTSGKKMNRAIANYVRGLDGTRFITNCINGFLAVSDVLGEVAGSGEYDGYIQEYNEREKAEIEREKASAGSEGVNAVMGGVQQAMMDVFAVSDHLTEQLEEISCELDAIGLNYLTKRHALEHELHPDRVVIGSETYPPEIPRLWKVVTENNHVIGDFTWTGYDYLGEAGIGIFHYDDNFTGQGRYPDRLAYTGDININGYRRPVSYLREIVYGLRKAPFIAVMRPDKAGQKYDMNNWKYIDATDSWTHYGYEGKQVEAVVISSSDEVELILNGKSLGKKKTDKTTYTACFMTDYEVGELTAVGYTNGKEDGRHTLVTAKTATEFAVETSKTALSSDMQDVAFITVDLVDSNGVRNMQEQKSVTVSVEGAGYLMGFGSANPSSEGSYQSPSQQSFDGRVMAAIRSNGKKGNITVTFSADGIAAKTVNIEVK